MSEFASPKIPSYRLTLFYGPEQDESNADTVYCVFNVKKRSWKGGVQVVVEVAQDQLAAIRHFLNFDRWLHERLEHLPENEREDYLDRGQDLFVQQVCQSKLLLAIKEGLRQENSRMSKDVLVAELNATLQIDDAAVKEEVLKELDIDSSAS